MYLFIGMIALSIILRLAAGGWDRDRIRTYIAARGGHMVEARWAPFGRGWFGEKGDRLYEVTFTDRDGRRREAKCKTSMFSGVYWTEGSPDVAAASAGGEDLEALRRENRLLRERLGQR